MNKMKKLLSVLLAVIMALSCMSVIASAEITEYQDVAELEALDAYSPYGTVTRLTTEERMSIFYDWLDVTLKGANISMGEVVNLLGIRIVIDLTSVDNLCLSLDSFKDSTSGFLWTVAKGLLGVLGDLNFDTWNTGIDRVGDSSLTLVSELLDLLQANRSVVKNILSTGELDLGLVTAFLKGVDLSAVTDIIGDIPGLVKGKLLPLFERWDDTAEEAVAMEGYQDGSDATAFTTILNTLLGNYFKKPMSMTTVKANSTGTIISGHTLPGDLAGSTHRRIYVQNGTEIVVYQYYFQTDVDANKTDNITEVGYDVVGTYTAQKEYKDLADSEYVFVMTKDSEGNAVENGEHLKYYQPGSYWLPSFVEAGGTIDVTSETGANLLYKMIPYVFDDLATVPANGSLKQVLAKFFGTTFKYVGEVGSDEVNALGNDSFFTQEKKAYHWGWSDYKVINGVHYYRYEDQIHVGNTEKANEYMNIINWDYEITSDLIKKYIPANTNSNSAAGYSKILHGINDFLIDVATEVANLDVLGVSFTKGDNTKLVGNLQKAAKAVLTYHPEHIFGTAYEDPDHYYNLIISDDINEVITGAAALAVDGLAKQMILPGAQSLKAQGVKVGAIGAAMLRELATQLLPHYDYDELIYSDYNTKTFLAGKDNSYWLDVLLTMGVDIGMKYLHNLADMNEDSTAWANLGYGESMTAAKKYSAASFDRTGWEDKVDYIIDWALTHTNDGSMLTWSMSTLVGKYVTDAGCTIDLASAQDPWAKIDAIFDNILFFDQFSSEQSFKNGLRGTIEDLLNLNVGAILGTASDPAILDVPASSRLITESLLSALSLEVKDLINGLFKNIGGGTYLLIPNNITTIDQLLTQSNLGTIVEGLLNALPTAYANGLLDTALPFINMFLGWSTDAQKYAVPSITMGSEYVYADATATTATTTINISNMSSGMLLKHRANIKTDGSFKSTVDEPYTLKITNVESSVAGTTFDKTAVDVAPYGTATISATLPYAGQDFVARFIITYRFVGKDGNNVGSENKLVVYQLFTSTKPESSTVGEVKDGTLDSYSVYIAAYESYVYTTDLYASVMGQKGTVSYSPPAISAPDRLRIAHAVTSTAMSANAAQYFAHVNTESTNSNPGPLEALGWTIYFGGDEDVDGKPAGTSGGLYTAKAGVTADTEFPLGLYDMGSIEMRTLKQNKGCNGSYSDSGNGRTFNWTYKYYYYEDFGIDATVAEYTDKMLLASDFAASAQDEFAAYETALMNAVKLAQYPIWCSYNDVIRPQIQDAVAALEAAYETLMNAVDGADASAEAADIAALEAALAKDDGDGETEINFQDYDLFEYFEYQDYRTALRNLAKTFYAPEVLDRYYILGSGISYDELSNDVIPNAANATIKAAITASMSERSEEELAASQQAHDDFVVPAVDELSLADQISRLEYYRQFILPIAADLTFLNREEAYAQANFPINAETEALYTADSWANYVEKYNRAVAMTASDLPSDVFDAKYNLMIAMKNLLLKSESAIENGATADLLANIEIANSILAMDLAEIKLSQVAIDAGLTVEEALGHLIYGLGYKYVGRDGYEYDLYVDSALEYTENDRPNVSTNTDKIDACNDNLAACIAYFDIAVAAPELGVIDGTTGVVGETTENEETGVLEGYIYGVAVGGADNQAYLDTYFKLEDESAGYTKKVASNLTGGSINGTGAKLEVYNNSDVKVAEYTLVVFGDVNGDAAADALDLSIVTLYTQNAGAMDELPKYAADVNGDNATDALDISNVTLYTQNAGSLTVNPRG